jgi:heparin binding hemagglutinin HbhA
MSNQPRATRIPEPIYAAAGAGDLAYRKLRELPAVIEELTEKAVAGGAELRERTAALRAAELREKAADTAAELRKKATETLRAMNSAATNVRTRAADGEFEADRLRELARRNAAALRTGAQTAQARARAVYHDLVARGERVVGTGVVQAAETINVDMEATVAPPAVTATPTEAAGKVAGDAAGEGAAPATGGTDASPTGR